MLKLEEIKKNAAVSGIEPGQVVRVVTTEPVGLDDNYNALTIYYKTSDGKLHERMLFRTDEAKLSLAEAGRPWAFDAPGEEFKLAAEAYRINLAHLFDPMMHQLIRALNQQGESAAGTLLARMPARAEPMRALAYRLYTLCERKGWAEEARAYNELVTAWSSIEQAAGEAGLVGSQAALDI